jgi:hypothetical protein
MNDSEAANPSVVMTYRLGDLYGVILHSWRRLLRILIVLEIIWIVLFVGMDVLSGVPLLLAISWLNWKLLGILGVAVSLFWFGLCPLIAYFRVRLAGLLGPNTFTLVDRGLRVEAPNSDGVIYWPAIRRTVRSSNRYYMFLVSRGAFVIPLRAFPDRRAFEQFADLAERRRMVSEVSQ